MWFLLGFAVLGVPSGVYYRNSGYRPPIVINLNNTGIKDF